MKKYLGALQVAELLDMKHATIKTYITKGLLPEPDVMIGKISGWSEETILKWQADRPGQGNHTKGESRRGGPGAKRD